MAIKCDCGYLFKLPTNYVVDHAGQNLSCPQCGTTRRLPLMPQEATRLADATPVVVAKRSRHSANFVTAGVVVFGGLVILFFYYSDATRVAKQNLASVKVPAPANVKAKGRDAVIPKAEAKSEVEDELVIQWLRENLDHPEWQAVKWWPPRDIKYVTSLDAAGREESFVLRLSRLKCRSKNQLGADSLFDFVFEYSKGKVDRVNPDQFPVYASIVESDATEFSGMMARWQRTMKSKEWLDAGKPKVK